MNASIDTIITVETPEGIAIAIRPAGFAVRCAAFLVDACIRGCVLLTLGSVLSVGGHFALGPIFIVVFFVNWLYPICFELLPAAATPGKRLFGLQVMMANGLPVTPAGCFIRNLMRPVDLLPSMYAFAIVLMLLRRDSRRLGDLAGGTLVAYRNEVVAGGVLAAGEPLTPPAALTTRQQAVIVAFASRVSRLTPERAEEIALLAKPLIPDLKPLDSMTLRLIGIARWLQGERPRPTASRSRAVKSGTEQPVPAGP